MAAARDEGDRSERIGIRMAPATLEAWKALMKRDGITMTELLERAVEHYGARDQADQFAAFGRKVAELAAELPRSRRR